MSSSCLALKRWRGVAFCWGKRFSSYLSHFLAVGLGVEGSFGQEDGVFLGGDTQLVVEGVVPDLLHVVPVGDDTVLDRVLQGEDASLGLSLVSDIGVLLNNEKFYS